ncbi:hypothetical protein [Clostridium estertheticum]|uniref:hypothetical protein n=1 Tax=Clostridium estertheticum TaxID=238834 RepID=UPI00124D5491|nr:hypothetical protein [Clostridium estertheticum]MBZ9615161.1 hypothetical protein [Clostridium estertheticum subsp. laramiense]WAG75055.1 hypothetical protein LL032_06280 [Clostridium estertheticum]
MQEIKVFEEFEHMLYKYRCYLENQFNEKKRAAFHPCEPLLYLYDMEKVDKDSDFDDELSFYDPEYMPMPESDFIHHADIILYSNDFEIWYSHVLDSEAEIIREVLNNVKPYYFADITANYYIELNCSNVFQLMTLLDQRVYGFVKNEYLNQCWQEVDKIGNLFFLQVNMPKEETKIKRGKSSVNVAMMEKPMATQQVRPEYEILNVSVKGEEYYCLGEYEPLIDSYDVSAYEDNVEFDFIKINMLLANANPISVFDKVIDLNVDTIKQIVPFARIIHKHALKSGNDFIDTIEKLKYKKDFQNSISVLTIPYNLMMHKCIPGFIEEAYKLLPSEVGGFLKTLNISEIIEEYIKSDGTIFPEFIEAQFNKIDQIYSNIASARQNIEAFSESGPRVVGGGFGIKGAVKGIITAQVLNLGMEGLNTLFQTVSANNKNEKIAKDVEKLYKSEAYNSILYTIMYHDVYSFLFYYIQYVNEAATNLRLVKANDFNLPSISTDFNDSVVYYLHILSKINKQDIYVNSNYNDKSLIELIKNAIVKYPYEYDYYRIFYNLSGVIDYNILRFAKIHGVDISNLAKEYASKIAKEKQKGLQNQAENGKLINIEQKNNTAQPQTIPSELGFDVKEQLISVEYKCLLEFIYIPDRGLKYLAKFKNAVISYAKLQQDEEVLFLFDNTVFGSAKDGFILTNKNIYFKNMFNNSSSISLKDIKTIESRKYSFLVNSNVEIEISTMSSLEKCSTLVVLLKLIISNLL